jgi:serine/threonine-protein kinase
MACVYHARDTRLGNECAIKALPLHEGTDYTESLAAFYEEARLLARLNHPGIVGVRDYFEEVNNAFLVMDFVPGANLYDLHRRAPDDNEDPSDLPMVPVSDAQVVSYGLMLSETLMALHRHDPPIIYRDLKPHNIMNRATDGRLILLDFGIARCFEYGLAESDHEPLGTPGYAAPEQYINGAVIDVRTDIYALGAVLHELATGYNPRGRDHYEPLPRPQDIKQYISPSLARILEACTDPDPAHRYQSALELCEELDRWRPATARSGGRPPVSSLPAWHLNVGATVTSPPLGSGAAIYYADNGGMVAGINPGTGDPLWFYREPGDYTSRTLVRTSLAVMETERFFAYSFPMADGKQGVSVLDARTGAAMWRSHEGLGKQAAPMLTSNGHLLIATVEPNQLIGIPISSGIDEWKRARDASPLTIVLAPARANRPELVLTTDRAGFVRAYHPESGRTIWRNQISRNAIVAPPVVSGDIVFLGGARGDTSFAGLNMNTGELLWRTPLAAEVVGPAAVVAERDLVVVPTRNAGLIGLDAKTGECRWHDVRFMKPLMGAAKLRGTPSVAVTEYGENGRVFVVNVAGEPTVTWEATLPPSGAIAAPLATAEFLIAAAADGTVTAWALT